MPSTRVHKFTNLQQVQTFLNGGVISARIPQEYGGLSGLYGLVGKTLSFLSPGPSGTVTFALSSGSNPDPSVLLFSDIKQQVEGAVTGLRVGSHEGCLVFIEQDPSAGVVISGPGDATDARPVLGLDRATDSVGKVYTPAAISGGQAPFYVGSASADGAHILYTWE